MIPVIRQRTKKIIKAGILGVLIATIPSVLVTGYFYKEKVKYEEEIERMKVQEDIITIYLLNEDLKEDEVINAKDIRTVMLTGKLSTNIPHISDIIGKRARINLLAGTPITADLLYENSDIRKDIRYHEFNYIKLPSRLVVGDYIDVRIVIPTGEDFIVLSKKKVKDFIKDDVKETVWLELTEEELLMLSGATIDSLVNKCSLYAITYIDNIQEAAIVNYPVNKELDKLIQNDPNIIVQGENVIVSKSRIEFEESFKDLLKEESDENNQVNESFTEEYIHNQNLIEQSLID